MLSLVAFTLHKTLLFFYSFILPLEYSVGTHMIGKCQKTKNSLVVGGIFPIFEMFPPKVKELSFYITPPPPHPQTPLLIQQKTQ
jgi:hypothetical protein